MRFSMISTAIRVAGAALVLVGAGAMPAEAHSLGAHGAGLAAGFTHPLFGLDHLLAMVAVGVWAAQHGGAARWRLPAAFAAMLAIGGVAGMAGAPFPMLESAIALSVLLLGGFILLALRPDPLAGIALVGAFALFHGYAHGTELPEAASPALYASGFLTASVLLHGCGIALAVGVPRLVGPAGLRAGGALVAAMGAFLMIGA